MRSLLLLCAPVFLMAQSKVLPVDWDVLPEAVKVAAKKQKAPLEAKVVYVTVERTPNNLLYEMKIADAKGRDREILFRPDGTIVETEEALPLKDVPAAARAAIEKERGSAQLIKVDRVTREGKRFYEGEMIENGIKRRPLFDSKGNRVE